MAEHIATVCGHPVSKAGIAQCRKCWRARGEDVPADQKVRIGICGHVISRGSEKGRCRKCHDQRRQDTQPASQLLEPFNSFDAAWAQWMKCVGMARDKYHPVHGAKTPTKAAQKGRIKVLVVPDVHAPFHEPQMLADMIAREADADKVICIGDLSDSYALSTYTHYRRVSFSEEWASVTAVMQALSEAFPDVEVVIGNHDARLEKRIRERLSEDMVDAVRYLSGGILCPITALAKRFPNVRVANHRVPGGDAVDWFTTCGDVWLGHPEKYSRTPGAALRFVEEWLADNEHALGLNRYRMIVLGHTHTYSQFLWRAGTMLIECGCLAQQQGYMLKPRIGGRPQRRGYVTFTQTDGRTDLNSVRFVSFDAMERVA